MYVGESEFALSLWKSIKFWTGGHREVIILQRDK